MKVWIDGAAENDAQPVFGLSTIERHLRILRRLKPQPDEIVISGGTDAKLVAGMSNVRRIAEDGPAGLRLAAFLRTVGSTPVLVIDGATVVDPRLVAFLANSPGSIAAFGGDGAERAAVLRLENMAVPTDAATLLALADRLLAAGQIAELKPEAFPSFIANLRRDLPFYLFTARDRESRDRRERFLFWSNYKGSTDFLTKWVYPPLVWRLVQLSTRWRLHPNWITLLSVILAFAAVPFFATGQFAIGLAMAFAMSILDSVDGKVARLTFTDSRIGNVLDHGLDIVHPPFWYLAWAWGLGGHGMDAVMQAALLLVGFYVADRLVLAVPKARFGRGLHSIHPIDMAVRTIIARRNVNLVLFTAGLLAGKGIEAFYLVMLWQGATFVWHAGRTAWLLVRPPAPRAAA